MITGKARNVTAKSSATILAATGVALLSPELEITVLPWARMAPICYLSKVIIPTVHRGCARLSLTLSGPIHPRCRRCNNDNNRIDG